MTSTQDTAPERSVSEVIRRERLLLHKDVRADSDQVLRLLHPAFMEHGASGRRWDRLSITEALGSEAAQTIRMDDVGAAMLAEDVVLLTYTARSGSTSTLRSSVWLRAESGEWLLRFHQGTPAQA
ncbi:MAG TPA: DUF4440 domain-containing protein [Actinomycetales bacterium]|nr:DUF4440 domain-containing protein [Actinomycetales bacterium]